MNRKNIFTLLFAAIIVAAFSSCDLLDDEPIEGSWVYQGIQKVEVSTNHPSLTRAIELDVYEYAADYEHALVFDGERMMKMYDYELEYSAYYSYDYDYSELMLRFPSYTEIHEFDIRSGIAHWRESYFDDYAYRDGYADEDMLYYLMNQYPFLRSDLQADRVDLRTLYIDYVDVIKKYRKID